MFLRKIATKDYYKKRAPIEVPFYETLTSLIGVSYFITTAQNRVMLRTNINNYSLIVNIINFVGFVKLRN